MRLSTLDFIFREAAANVRRNALMSLACVTTVAVTLGFSAFVVLGFRNAENLLRQVAQELVVATYLKTDVTPQQRKVVGRRIAHIRHVQGRPILVSKEHAWRSFSATIPDSLKGEVDGNPLPDTFMITVDTPSHVAIVARRIERMPEVDRVNAPYLEAQRASAILRFTRLATTAVTLLLILVTAFLVMNTIRLTLYARRHEIRVMQLVGATNGYIRAPFILEGLALGAIGGAAACGIVAAGYPYLLHLVHRALAFDLPLINPGRQLLPFYGQIAATGAAVGALGSLVSVRKFLRPVEYHVAVQRLRPQDLERLDAERDRLERERIRVAAERTALRSLDAEINGMTKDLNGVKTATGEPKHDNAGA